MADTTHLVSLSIGLSNERERLAKARTKQEKEIRSIWVAQLEKEFAQEEKYLGFKNVDSVEMNDEDLLNELGL